MKKRIALVALSVVLVFSLAIGGTLMFFSAPSEKAINVVSIGNGVEIELWEYTPAGLDTNGFETDVFGGDTYAFVDNDTFTGINFNTLLDSGDYFTAGSELEKRPLVKNTGKLDVYVFAEFVVAVPVNQDITLTPSEVDEYAQAFIDGIGFDPTTSKWYALSLDDVVVDYDSVGNTLTIKGGFFYSVGDGTQTLGVLAVDEVTPDIITGYTIPWDVDKFTENSLQLDITAYALQADGNTIETVGGNHYEEWIAAFNAAFDGLDIGSL
jgi:hypothetical protein